MAPTASATAAPAASRVRRDLIGRSPDVEDDQMGALPNLIYGIYQSQWTVLRDGLLDKATPDPEVQ
jgi:hypothetical protein